MTNSREANYNEEQKRALASAMNHKYDTAERYYNYQENTKSVTKTLSLQKNKSFNSSAAYLEFSSDETVWSSTPRKRSAEHGETDGTSMKKIRLQNREPSQNSSHCREYSNSTSHSFGSAEISTAATGENAASEGHFTDCFWEK